MTEYDLAVIGTGVAGSTAAAKCRKAGWRVAIIDFRPYGGTCALRGCDPKKVIHGAAEIIERFRGLKGKGIAGEARIDWKELINFKRSFTQPVPERRERSFAEMGIETYHGKARFVDRSRLRVDGEEIKARYFLIATGAKPRRLKIPGEEFLITSEQFLELKTLPESIIFAGGGYISFEFAHMAARAGAKVTILHRGSKPLPAFDPDLVDKLVLASSDAGIDVVVNASVEGVEKKDDFFLVRSKRGGKEVTFEADLVVHGAGRVPDIDDLNLEAADVEFSKRGVAVNEYMQTSNPVIYAAGDAAASGAPLTPTAAYEASIATENMMNGNKVKVNYDGLASVLFSIPPLASAGLREDQARERGIKYRVKFGDTSDWYSSRRIGLKHSAYKILLDEEDRVIGAHLLGHNAEEVINLFSLAIRAGMKAEEIKEAIYAYPTAGYDIKYML